MIPGTNVFCGLPFMKGIPSNKQAVAKTVDGDISVSQLSLTFNIFSKFSHLSLTPGISCENLSVLADHRTITFFKPCSDLKFLMSYLSSST